VIGIAIIAREMLSPLLGVSNPYHTVWLAVVFSTWYCGMGPSVVRTLLSVVGIRYLFLPHSHSFALQNPEVKVSGMIGFLVFSGLIIALGEANRRSRRYQNQNRRLLSAGELESIRSHLPTAQVRHWLEDCRGGAPR
jgi:K+-sensing histidine kinase KdpD